MSDMCCECEAAPIVVADRFCKACADDYIKQLDEETDEMQRIIDDLRDRVAGSNMEPIGWLGSYVEIYLRENRLEEAVETHCFLGVLKGISAEGYILREVSAYTNREIFVPRERVLYLARPIEEGNEDDDA